ncbi:MAG TPA: hypothetical protein VGH54_02280 [Mycobacterium sp.]|jgi:hypothetical protein
MTHTHGGHGHAHPHGLPGAIKEIFAPHLTTAVIHAYPAHES